MKSLSHNKNVLVSLFMILFGLVFLYFLFLESRSLQKGTDWLLAFIKMIVFYYALFVLSSSIQILLVFLFKIFPLKVFSIYPFTYDGKWRFHPIRLFYNIEGFSNSLVLNLSQFINDPKKLRVSMKKLLMIRKISLLLVVVFLFLLFQQFNSKTVFLFLVVLIGLILSSYFRYDDFWIGYDYLYLEGNDALVNFLYCSKSIMLINGVQYAKRYEENHGKHMIEELSILENYLYRCILEKQTFLSADVIQNHLIPYRNPETIFSFHLALDTKWLNVLKLIGIVGFVCENDEYMNCSIEELTRIYTEILNNSTMFFIEHGTNVLKSEIESMKLLKEGYNNHQIVLQDLQNVFSVYDELFQK